MADGKVVHAGWAGAYGKAVLVRHPSGKRSLYAHLSAIAVHKGQKVRSGQRLGKVGSTGNTTGPHLHFEVLRNGDQRDPQNFL